MGEKPADEIKAVVSASECTGIVPAIPADGVTGTQRSLMRVHAAARRVFRKRAGKR